MMIKEVILHAGVYKTGTSSIQDTLYHNCELLKDAGFLYIKDWNRNQSMAIKNIVAENPYDHPLSILNQINTPEKLSAYNNYNIEKMLLAMNNSQCHTLIISAEIMFHLSEKELLKLKSFFVHTLGDISFKVIIFTRNHIAYAPSMIQEFTIRENPNMLDAINGFTIKYKDIHKSITRVFDNIIFIEFEEASRKGLVKYFLNLLNVPDSFLPGINIFRSNEARCGEVIELITYINDQEPQYFKSELKKNKNREIGDVNPLFPIKGTKFDIPYELKMEFLAATKNDALYLKELTGIDYTNNVIEPYTYTLAYTRETIDGFINAFPKLSYDIQSIFLDFFKNKYRDTGNEAFKRLFDEDSTPYKMHLFAKEFGEITGNAGYEHEWKERIWSQRYKQPDCVQIFTNYSNGYSHENCYTYPIEGSDLVIIDLEFNLSKNITEFRIDPSKYSSVILLKEILVNNRKDNCILKSSNNDDRVGDAFFFLSDDPQLYYTTNETVASIHLEMYVDSGTYPFYYFANRMGNGMRLPRNEIFEKTKKIEELLAAKRALDHEIEENRQRIIGKDRRIEELMAIEQSLNHSLEEHKRITEDLNLKQAAFEQEINDSAVQSGQIFSSLTWKWTSKLNALSFKFLPLNSKRRNFVKKLLKKMRFLNGHQRW